ncbi:MAG: DUF5667 domain-containing protein [Chloroflexi bacterium]|nr:DUF5667 domain-containing protein [Chloroflexota bacterium]
MNNNLQNANDIDQAFEDCLDMLNNGASLEDCLSLYPQYTDQLSPMLKTARLTHDVYNEIKPLTGSQTRIQVAVMQAVYPQKNNAESFFRKMFRTPAVVFSIVALLIFIVGGSALAAISQNTMPDNALYSIKRTSENIELFFNFTDNGKASQSYKMAERRADELVYAISHNDAKAATAIFNDFKKYYYMHMLYTTGVKPQTFDYYKINSLVLNTAMRDYNLRLYLKQALAVANVYLSLQRDYNMIDSAAFISITHDLTIILAN